MKKTSKHKIAIFSKWYFTYSPFLLVVSQMCIKKPDNSIGLYVINYGFNFFIWIIVIAHFNKISYS